MAVLDQLLGETCEARLYAKMAHKEQDYDLH